MIHYLEEVHVSRDPDRRREAFALCGAFEECSGSGKHSMVQTFSNVTCPQCLKFREAFERDREEERLQAEAEDAYEQHIGRDAWSGGFSKNH